MGLTVGSWQIADTRVQSVTLRPVVGAFELIFGLHATIRAYENVLRRASIAGTRVTVKAGEGERQTLGFARPETPFEIVCKSGGSTMTPDLHLYLQPGQLAALETLRGTGDLNFEFLASGTGTDENGEQYVHGHWRILVSRSDWIENLRNAGARNVLLLEVPFPFDVITDSWREIATALRRAERNLSTTLRHCRLRFTEQSLLLWMSRVG